MRDADVDGFVHENVKGFPESLIFETIGAQPEIGRHALHITCIIEQVLQNSEVTFSQIAERLCWTHDLLGIFRLHGRGNMSWL